jgi:hypothetical protein
LASGILVLAHAAQGRRHMDSTCFMAGIAASIVGTAAALAGCADAGGAKPPSGWAASPGGDSVGGQTSDDADYGGGDDGDDADAYPGDDGGGQEGAPQGDGSGGSGDGDAGIVLHGEAQGIVGGVPAAACSLPMPPQSAPGDLLIAALLFGNVSATDGVTVSQPPGWNELGQPVAVTPDKASLLVFWAVNGASLAWPAVWQISGTGNTGIAWLLSFAGVDTSNPPAFSGETQSESAGATSWPSPMLPAAQGDVILATFGGFSGNPDGGPAIPTWSLPAPWTALAVSNDGNRRSAIVAELRESHATTSAQVTARASGPNLPQYVTAALVALKPL